MKTIRQLLIASSLALSVSACATVGSQPWAQNVQQDSVKLAQQAKQVAGDARQSAAAAIQQLQQRYNARRAELMTHTDDDSHVDAHGHSEADALEAQLLQTLHRARAALGSHGEGAAAAPAARTAKMSPPAHALPPAGPPQLENADYRWPLDAYIVSSEYGQRWGKLHKGIDLAADSGDPVYAIADGEVIYAGDTMRGYGNAIVIRHRGRISSLYAHNSELKVKQGDIVTRGTLIALLGSTGHSTGPHVHFEIRDGDTAINPNSVMPQAMVATAASQRGAVARR